MTRTSTEGSKSRLGVEGCSKPEQNTPPTWQKDHQASHAAAAYVKNKRCIDPLLRLHEQYNMVLSDKESLSIFIIGLLQKSQHLLTQQLSSQVAAPRLTDDSDVHI